jgi:hypothetical protein
MFGLVSAACALLYACIGAVGKRVSLRRLALVSHELYVRRQGIVCHTTEHAGVRKLKKKKSRHVCMGYGDECFR